MTAETMPREVRKICCANCKEVMYRTDGDNLLSPNESDEIGWTIEPVQIEVAKRVRYLFCSKTCFIAWALAQREDDLRGGYPLW